MCRRRRRSSRISARARDRLWRFRCASSCRPSAREEVDAGETGGEDVLAAVAVPIGDEDAVHDAFEFSVLITRRFHSPGT